MKMASFDTLFEPLIAMLTAWQNLFWLALATGAFVYLAAKYYAESRGYSKKESRVFAGIVAEIPYLLVILVGVRFIIPWGEN